MTNTTTNLSHESRPEWEHLEDWIRGQVPAIIQELLDQDVTEFLGRSKSARRSEQDNGRGYRNSDTSATKLSLASGTIDVKRARVRNSEQRFVRWLLPPFARRTKKVAELYLHGLSEEYFDLALHGL